MPCPAAHKGRRKRRALATCAAAPSAPAGATFSSSSIWISCAAAAAAVGGDLDMSLWTIGEKSARSEAASPGGGSPPPRPRLPALRSALGDAQGSGPAVLGAAPRSAPGLGAALPGAQCAGRGRGIGRSEQRGRRDARARLRCWGEGRPPRGSRAGQSGRSAAGIGAAGAGKGPRQEGRELREREPGGGASESESDKPKSSSREARAAWAPVQLLRVAVAHRLKSLRSHRSQAPRSTLAGGGGGGGLILFRWPHTSSQEP